MATFRIRGPQDGSDLGTVSATIGALSDSAAISSYRFPSTQTTHPTIGDAFVADGTLTPDDNGITVTTRAWRNADTQASLGSGATLSTSGLGGVWVEYSPDNGTTWSPPVMVYMDGSDATHNADDAAILTIVPHSEATHIAVNTGAWTSPSTWSTGEVPKNGAFVLIPHGVSVKYDNEEANIRLDRVRVDGTLWIDAANLTTETLTMLVETIVVTRGATFTAGTSGNGRIPATASVEIIISGKDYSATSYLPTDIKPSRFESARGWERGFIVQGTRRLWGAEKLTWAKADPIDAGATSLTLHTAPTGWAIGDTIVIGGTDLDITGSGNTDEDPMEYVKQDEERVITGISGNVISWSGGLTNPHKNQLSGSTRTDLYPNIMAKGNKNITIRSEVTSPVWRRGHDVQMHHHTVVDLWDAQFIDLGRTDKEFNSGIIKTTAPDQMWGIPDEEGYGIAGSFLENRPLTNRSNLQSRYSIHLHHVGFNHSGARPIVSNCYVEGSPGWAVVHHSCDADFQGLAIYKFFGAGLISEQGDELGAWVDCLAMHATATAKPRAYKGEPRTFNTNPKIADNYGQVGDGGRHGYGFYFRGRAMRTNRCVGNSVGWAHVFFNRGTNDPSLNVVPMRDLERTRIDIQGAASGLGGVTDEAQPFNPINYPIIHHADNEAVATFGGLFVTKTNQRQTHDVNIKIKRLKSWGYMATGAMVEYIGTYILDQFDCVAGPSGNNGIIVDANTYQVAVVNPRVEGGTNGIKIGAGGDNHEHSQDDPRWVVFGLETVDISGDPYFHANEPIAGSSNVDATLVIDDFDGSYINYDQDPSESYPLILIDADSNGASIFDADNTDGQKTDNISSGADLIWKTWDDRTLKPQGVYRSQQYGKLAGRWTYGGKDTIVFTDIISDRLTARPHKVTKMTQTPTDTYFSASPENGAYTYVATPVSASDVTAVVAKDGSVVIDVLTDASPSGGNGSFVIDAPDSVITNKEWPDSIKPDNGIGVIDGTAGTVTYTPDRDYTGTDEFYVFVRSGSQYATVRINVLITDSGTDGGTTQPAETTHFTVFDGGTQTIDVTLLAPPDTSNRRIERVFYSTNGGTNWRRLCHKWPQATHKISVDSTGSAITAGSYDILLKYRTDHDYVDVTAAAAASVTVS